MGIVGNHCKSRWISYQYNYNHFELLYPNYGYLWILVAAPELEHQQNCSSPSNIPPQKKVGMSVRVLVVVLGQQTTTQLP